MKLVEMYFALDTISTLKDYFKFVDRYENELNVIDESIVKERHASVTGVFVPKLRSTILEILQDFDIKEVLDQAETLFNDILRHEEES